MDYFLYYTIFQCYSVIVQAINKFHDQIIKLGQRVKSFTVEFERNGNWHFVSEGTTIGYKRIVRQEQPVEPRKIWVNIDDSRSCPVISNVEIY